MKPFPWTVLLPLLLLLCCGFRAGGREPRFAQLDSGPIQGTTQDRVGIFLGIPYAAPPVGALRWQPPQPVAAWTEVRQAAAFGPACPQTGPLGQTATSEDCLFLNVWTPARQEGSRLPVMVWLHGGAFNFGTASQPEYDGKRLARHGVVVVTLNYRLGPLGFFVHPGLARESGQGTSGNYGLLDQIAALKWVQTNIAAFGGDPEQVTVFGQSAGSRSVSLLTLSPLSAGLFHGAIAQSGGPILGSHYLNPVFNGDPAGVAAMGRELAARLGCDGADDVPAALRAKPAQDILEAAATTTSLFDAGLFFAPVFDGRVLPRDPLSAYAEGRQHDVPMIVGSTGNEGALYLRGATDLTLARYAAFLRARFGDAAEAALAMFPAPDDADVPGAIDTVLTVGANAQPARFMARAMAGKTSKAYLYQFTRRPDTALGRQYGAHHGVELAYVFGTMKPEDGYTETDLELSRQMMAYWVQFARTGDPNGPGLAPWPAYDRASDANLEFSDTIRVNRHLFREACDFIDGQAKERP